nr:hypothetical protein [uncultured Kingella sp.]
MGRTVFRLLFYVGLKPLPNRQPMERWQPADILANQQCPVSSAIWRRAIAVSF